MALTQTDLDALDAAIASGERRVTVDGRTVEYHSLAELLQARAHAAQVLSNAGGQRSGPRWRRAVFADD
jgi:hypothetical protein